VNPAGTQVGACWTNGEPGAILAASLEPAPHGGSGISRDDRASDTSGEPGRHAGRRLLDQW
jgi:hypothetical protein